MHVAMPAFPYRAPFRLLWDERRCQPKYAKAFCIEVSERGMSFDTFRETQLKHFPEHRCFAERFQAGTLVAWRWRCAWLNPCGYVRRTLVQTVEAILALFVPGLRSLMF